MKRLPLFAGNVKMCEHNHVSHNQGMNSMTEFIYLDNNATTPVEPRVVEAMLPYLGEKYGNPSSIYTMGREARQAVNSARESVAKLIGAQPEEIIFTSGGTESDNLAIKGIAFALREKGNHIITSAVEHHAVLNTCKWMMKNGFEVTYVGVDSDGVINLNELKSAITPKTILITVMHANNETGTIEPIEEVAAIAKERGIVFHTDAVQSVGKIPVDARKQGVNLLSISGHKIYGPKGVGALYVKKGTRMTSLFQGGHHEWNRRSGTENVAGIVGLGRAAEIAREEMADIAIREGRLRDRLLQGIMNTVPDILVAGNPEKGLANTLMICVKYVEGEAILLHLDAMGVAASSGSACTSGSLDPSHVLLAMGVPVEVAHGSVRFSLGRSTTEEQIDHVIKVFAPIVENLRAMSPETPAA